MGKSQRKGGWTTDLHAINVVLGTVAGALKLVLCGNPGDDASQMGADSVDTEVLDCGSVFSDDKVGGVALQDRQPKVASAEIRTT